MKYILTLMLLVTSLFAHERFESHLHFLNSFHLIDIFLIFINMIAAISIYKYFKKETRKLKPNVDILEISTKDDFSILKVIEWINLRR